MKTKEMDPLKGAKCSDSFLNVAALSARRKTGGRRPPNGVSTFATRSISNFPCPRPSWGRGWIASGAFTSRGETGEGVRIPPIRAFSLSVARKPPHPTSSVGHPLAQGGEGQKFTCVPRSPVEAAGRYSFITGLLTLMGLDKHRFRLYYEP